VTNALLLIVVVVAILVAIGASPRPPRGLRIVAWTLVVLIGLPILGVGGFLIYIMTPMDGDRLARAGADDAAHEIAERLDVPAGESLDGKRLALLVERRVAELESRRFSSGEDRYVEILLLDWAGSMADAGGAYVDLRVEKHSPWDGVGDGGWFDYSSRGSNEGHAIECRRLRVEAGGGVTPSEIDCPDSLPTAVPAGGASLGPDPEGRLREMLAAVPPDADEDVVGRALRETFALDEVPGAVQYRAQGEWRTGTMIVTVGLTTRRECVVMVREEGDEPYLFTDYLPTDLAPGRAGCSTSLYPSAGQVEYRWEHGNLPGTPPLSASPDPTEPEGPVDASDPENERLLLKVLASVSPDADEAVVLAEIEEEFPEYTAEVRRVGDEVAVSVMGPGHRDCLVGVRAGSGEPFRFTDFPRVQLELGELGCSPSLYWSNVTAH
jgi:hypothetical protein